MARAVPAECKALQNRLRSLPTTGSPLGLLDMAQDAAVVPAELLLLIHKLEDRLSQELSQA